MILRIPPEYAGYSRGLLKTWLPVSLSRRTPRGSVLSIPIKLFGRHSEPKPRWTYRNPVIFTTELRDPITVYAIDNGLLAGKFGILVASVSDNSNPSREMGCLQRCHISRA